METFWIAILSAALGSALIILNEWVKTLFEQKKQKKKLAIWSVLEEKAPTTLTIEDLTTSTGIDTEQVESLIYEMMREGIVIKAQFGNFTTYKPRI